MEDGSVITTSFVKKKTPTRGRYGIFPDVYFHSTGEALSEKPSFTF
jgi:hypothetical protein